MDSAVGGFPIWRGSGPIRGPILERSPTAVASVGNVSPSRGLLRSTCASTRERGPSSAASATKAFPTALGSASTTAPSTDWPPNMPEKLGLGMHIGGQQAAVIRLGVPGLFHRPASDSTLLTVHTQLHNPESLLRLLMLVVKANLSQRERSQAAAERVSCTLARTVACASRMPRPGTGTRP